METGVTVLREKVVVLVRFFCGAGVVLVEPFLRLCEHNGYSVEDVGVVGVVWRKQRQSLRAGASLALGDVEHILLCWADLNFLMPRSRFISYNNK